MSGIIGSAGSKSGILGKLAPGTTVLLYSGYETADHNSSNDGGFVTTALATGATILPHPGNDILIYFSVSLSSSSGSRFWAHIRKGGSDLTGSIANASGNRKRTTIAGSGTNSNAIDTTGSIMYLDVNPYTGSALTYDILIQPESGQTVHMNQSNSDSDSATVARTCSSLQVFEIHR